jgi:hypothetical protein
VQFAGRLNCIRACADDPRSEHRAAKSRGAVCREASREASRALCSKRQHERALEASARALLLEQDSSAPPVAAQTTDGAAATDGWRPRIGCTTRTTGMNTQPRTRVDPLQAWPSGPHTSRVPDTRLRARTHPADARQRSERLVPSPRLRTLGFASPQRPAEPWPPEFGRAGLSPARA